MLSQQLFRISSAFGSFLFAFNKDFFMDDTVGSTGLTWKGGHGHDFFAS
jgi:hypothetical protein